MKKFLGLMLVIVTLFIGGKVVYAALADVNTSLGADDVYEINNATPGTSKTFLGSRLRGPLEVGATTWGADTLGNSSVYITPEVTAFIKTSHGSRGESIRLGDGYQNHQITFVLSTDGGANFTITPLTKTGFTSLQLDDAKDACTVKFINTVTGWVLVGNNGCTIN